MVQLDGYWHSSIPATWTYSTTSNSHRERIEELEGALEEIAQICLISSILPPSLHKAFGEIIDRVMVKKKVEVVLLNEEVDILRGILDDWEGNDVFDCNAYGEKIDLFLDKMRLALG